MPILRQHGKCPLSRGEEGFILIAVLFLAALLLIALAVAAPRMAKSIQRDKELELVHRGEQYRRAIQLYYRKFGAYPNSINQLLNTNNIRFLRKRYTDPITGKDDWRLIHLGQAKVPPLGFFGQPLSGMPGAANIGTPVSAATGATAGETSAFGSPASSSAFGPSSSGAMLFSSSSDSGVAGQDASSSPSATTPAPGANPAAAGTASGTGTGAAGTSSAGFGTTSAGGTSPTIGGGPIVGVGIPNTKASLLAYKKQTHYNQWEFVYNPIEDQLQAAGMLGAGGQTVDGTSGATGSSPFGSNSGTSSSPFGTSSGSGGSGFGSGSSFGSGSGAPGPPTGSSPQQ